MGWVGILVIEKVNRWVDKLVTGLFSMLVCGSLCVFLV